MFPGFKTAIHTVINKEHLLNEMCEFSESTFMYEKREIDGYEIPFFKNFYGETPLHRATDAQNMKALEILLNYLKHMSFDHHDRLIQDQLPYIIDSGLSMVSEYLDARILTMPSLNGLLLRRGPRKESGSDEYDFLFNVIPAWQDMNYFANKIFNFPKPKSKKKSITKKIKKWWKGKTKPKPEDEKGGYEKVEAVEAADNEEVKEDKPVEDTSSDEDSDDEKAPELSDVETRIVGYCDVFNNGPLAKEIIATLSEVEDLDLYKSKFVRVLIANKWKPVQWHVFFK